MHLALAVAYTLTAVCATAKQYECDVNNNINNIIILIYNNPQSTTLYSAEMLSIEIERILVIFLMELRGRDFEFINSLHHLQNAELSASQKNTLST